MLGNELASRGVLVLEVARLALRVRAGVSTGVQGAVTGAQLTIVDSKKWYGKNCIASTSTWLLN